MAGNASTAAGRRRAAARAAKARGSAKRSPRGAARARSNGHPASAGATTKAPKRTTKAPKRTTKAPKRTTKAPRRAPKRSAVKPKRARAQRRPSPRKKRTARALHLLRPRLPGRRLFTLGSWRRRLTLIIVAVVGLTAFYFGWFRDSPLVAVRDVQVEGVTTADRERIAGALTASAKEMTTLHLDQGRLLDAVAAFPSVASVSADPSFPSGVTIHVVERRPALLAEAAGRGVPVADDGTVLAGMQVPADEAKRLPVLHVSEPPGSGRLAGSDLQQALILGAAPEPLRPLIEGIEWSPDEGTVVTIRGEIPIYFGTGGRAEAKWAAAAAILADPKLKALSYVDVRVPERPAVGGTGQGAVAEAPLAPPPATAPIATPPEDTVAPDPAATTTDPGTASTLPPASP